MNIPERVLLNVSFLLRIYGHVVLAYTGFAVHITGFQKLILRICFLKGEKLLCGKHIYAQ